MGCQQSIETPTKLSQNPIKPDKFIQFLQNLKPNEILSKIQNGLNKTIMSLQNDPFLSEISFWSDIIKRFDDLFLDKDEQLQLLQFMFNFLKTNMQKQNGLNQKQFFKQMGEKFNEFEKRIYLKHKMCLKYFKYVKKEKNQNKRFNTQCLKFDMNLQQTKIVAQKVRQLFEVNMEAFSFLSLYLLHSINNLIQRGKTFIEIQSILDQNLKQLQKLYPATVSGNQELNQKTSIDLQKIEYVQNPYIIKLKKIGKSKFHQVQEYIFKKAQKAIEDQQKFVQLVKSVCLQKGYAFKSGLKIKDPLHHSAIQRTFQKLLSAQKFQPTLKDLKTKSINNSLQQPKDPKIDSKSNIKLKDYIEKEKNMIMQKVKQILQKQTQLQFNVKDLLRAKCMFNTIDDIKETLQNLLSKIRQEKLSVYQIKDRLNKKTKDITVIINLPNTRAQLQLALKFDKVSNEFNHKIYELMRSIKFTTITNIQIHNEKWGDSFFNSQIYLFYRMLKMKNQKDFEQKITFKDLKNDAEQFIKTYLENDFLGINLIVKQEPNAQKIIENSFNQLNQILFKNTKVKL